jgi:hypothetical protein
VDNSDSCKCADLLLDAILEAEVESDPGCLVVYGDPADIALAARVRARLFKNRGDCDAALRTAINAVMNLGKIIGCSRARR